MFKKIKDWWIDYWYEWVSIPWNEIKFGGGPQGFRRLRKERINNIIHVINALIILYLWYILT